MPRASGTAVLIVGHVTKDGAIAGPRMLEHLVDTVLYFERDAGSRFRRVRAAKNRFGAANELGFFLMQENGLREVRNPSAIFLSRAPQPVVGSLVMVTRDGTRPLLVEVQALVDPSRFGAPRRVAQGIDAGRLAMVLAVLHRHGGMDLQEHDVFANVVGGLDIDEPAWDLPVALALASSLRECALPPDLVVFGELGLTGEVRPVTFGEERIREAAKLGFRRALVPEANVPRATVEGIEVRASRASRMALRKCWASPRYNSRHVRQTHRAARQSRRLTARPRPPDRRQHRRNAARSAHGAARSRRGAAGGQALHRCGEGQGGGHRGHRQPHAGPGADRRHPRRAGGAHGRQRKDLDLRVRRRPSSCWQACRVRARPPPPASWRGI